jgi:hypothetical protein
MRRAIASARPGLLLQSFGIHAVPGARCSGERMASLFWQGSLVSCVLRAFPRGREFDPQACK